MTSAQPVFLMSPPRRDWRLQGQVNFRSAEAPSVDPEKARSEWTELANAITAAGGDVIVCPPNPRRRLSGMVYAAEAGEFFRAPDGAPSFLLPNMAVEHRRFEADWIGGFVAGLGCRTVAVRAKWEAQGDVLRSDGGAFVVHTFGSGRSRRTEARAYHEVAHVIGGRHIQLHFRAAPWFHGNMFLAFYHGRTLPPRLGEEEARTPTVALVCPQALMPGELQRLERFVPHAQIVRITKEQSLGYDTNCLQVNQTVIVPTSVSSRAERAFRSLGLTVVKLRLTELCGKGGGGPVCLTNRLWSADPAGIPTRMLWSARPAIEAHTDM